MGTKTLSIVVLLSTSSVAVSGSLDAGRKAGAGVAYNYDRCISNYWNATVGKMKKAESERWLRSIGGVNGWLGIYTPDCQQMAEAWNQGRDVGLAERSQSRDPTSNADAQAAAGILGLAAGVAAGAVSAGGRGAPLGYITQPNGRQDPYYAKRPCATTVQTGPTSYACTNY